MRAHRSVPVPVPVRDDDRRRRAVARATRKPARCASISTRAASCGSTTSGARGRGTRSNRRSPTSCRRDNFRSRTSRRIIRSSGCSSRSRRSRRFRRSIPGAAWAATRRSWAKTAPSRTCGRSPTVRAGCWCLIDAQHRHLRRMGTRSRGPALLSRVLTAAVTPSDLNVVSLRDELTEAHRLVCYTFRSA